MTKAQLIWLVIVVVGAVNYAARLSFIAFFARRDIPPLLAEALKHVPAAMLTAIVVPAVVFASPGTLDASLSNPRVLAALVAGVIADRVYAARESREAARERRSLVLDSLRDARSPSRGEELGLLLAVRCPVPFRGRSRELARLAAWREGGPGCPVIIVAGPAGVGKSRLALEFAALRCAHSSPPVVAQKTLGAALECESQPPVD